ncbi:unnamed protein product [Prorocentrum cordatum]|nr:unnamed protein product [Polarella glacialis]
MADKLLTLYDYDYVEGGCIGTPPDGTATDDSFGTYATNYLILAIGVAAALPIFFNPRAGTLSKILGPSFFLLNGLGYGVAGYLHQVIHHTAEFAVYALWFKTSYVAAVLGVLAFHMYSNYAHHFSIPETDCCKACLPYLNGFAIVPAVIIVAMQVFVGAKLLQVGVYSVVVMIYALFTFLRAGGGAIDRVTVVGIVLIIVGYLAQPVLDPICGDSQSADCFSQCPLPAPYFNHNAMFHLLFAIGLAVLGVTLSLHPLETRCAQQFEALV